MGKKTTAIKDPRFGKKITSIDDLIKLREERGSVISATRYCFGHERPMPAAFILNMSASIVHNTIRLGNLHVYRKPRSTHRYRRTGEAAK